MTSPILKLWAAFGTGLLLFVAMPGSPGIALCAWVALTPLLIAARTSSSPANAAWLGLGSGMIFYTLSLSWITIVLGTYGHLDGWLSVMALLLLALYMSLYLAIFTGLCRWFGDRLPFPLFAPTLWVGLDFLRAGLFSGFPWLDLGYSQFQTNPVLQSADLFGHHTVTFLIVMVNAMLATVYRLVVIPKESTTELSGRKQLIRTAILPAAILLAAAFFYGLQRQQQVTALCRQAETMIVSVAQGDIPQDKKWSANFQQETIDRYLSLSNEALSSKKPPNLLIWPETALPFYPMESPYFVELVEQLVSKRDANLLFGAPHRQRTVPHSPPQYFNSAFLVVPADRPLSGMHLPLAESPPPAIIKGRYDKQHLVPFGEYIPMRSLLPFLAPVVDSIGDFTPGLPSGPISCENARIGVLICFESIFPELARSRVTNGANLLVNITNDAWFGRSNAPWQHLSMAVFRAVENRRSLARAANSGISGCFDPLGRSARLTTLFTTDQVTAKVPLLNTATFFNRYGHHFGAFCLWALLPALIWVRRSRKTDQEK